MKHVPSCRSAALITAATGTVLVTTAFGVLPAVAATDATEPVSASTVSSSSTPDTSGVGSVAAPAAPGTSSTAEPTSADPTSAAPTSADPSTAAPSTVAPSVPAPASTGDAGPAGDAVPAPAPTPEAPATAAPAADGPTDTEVVAAAPDDASAPSYAEGASASSPRVLPTVRAGESFSADLRANDAAGATYTLTTVEGTDVALDAGLAFHDGVLEGTATSAGTFTVRVTATNEHGTASQWVRQTVEPAAVVGVGVVVHGVPAAPDGSYTWVASDGSVDPGPISVPLGGSVTLVPWTIDQYDNTTNATDRAEVWASEDSDQVVRGADGFTVTFTHASTHTIWVSVDGVCTEFTIEVVDGTAETPTTPTEPTDPLPPVDTPPVDTSPLDPAPVDPAPQDGGTVPVLRVTPTAADAVAAPVVSGTTPAATRELAWTGTDTAAPVGWAAALLAAGAALLGLRRVRRSRHRA
ncbi:hypothetical protein DEJ23_09050 [Curtobacterium sp. MCSS17_008]|uniref:hypothetical protein n=1 Tax=Curtobacterium sp. MCSS17_008 TaxID=2175647 RepID=UPI000DA7E593|nr:hypothetical protein [Curtobacterium sp. MCSS17_008]PZF56703.1 hypothetical protein DEJ23_09050 [Curtobacterium sp. MCSS17_008]